MNTKLTSEQIEILTGHLLGDGGFIMGKRCINPRFVVGRAAKDDVYAVWSSKKLENLIGNKGVTYCSVYDKRTKKTYDRVTVRTIASELLLPLYKIWYDGRIKRVPAIRLSPLIVAIWFADDGWISLRKSKKTDGTDCNTNHYEVGFATNGFTYTEVKYLRDLLTLEIGIEFHINKTKSNCNRGWVLRHSTNGMIALVNYIKDIFPPLKRKSKQWGKGVDLWKKEWYPNCIFCNSDKRHHIGKTKSGSEQFRCLHCGKNYRSCYKQLQGEVKTAKYINNLCKTNLILSGTG